MTEALESKAQPHQLILQTQQSFNQLLAKVNQREESAQELSVQKGLA